MRNFRSNRSGVVAGLVVMIASIFVVAIAWIVTLPMVTSIWSIVIPMFPSSAPLSTVQTMNTLNIVMGLTLLVLVIGCIAYGLAYATHRDPYEVPG